MKKSNFKKAFALSALLLLQAALMLLMLIQKTSRILEPLRVFIVT